VPETARFRHMIMREDSKSRTVLTRLPARRRGGAVLCCTLLAAALGSDPAFGQAASQPTTSSAPSQPAGTAATAPTSAPASPDQDLENIDLLSLDIQKVVTASRREQKASSVPYALSVVTAEDIRRNGVHSIPDALRLVPGVDVADLSYGIAAVSPRGFQGIYSTKVLVLVDGRQIFDPLFGGTFWGSWPFQLEDIQRIEVIRGPGGVTWGANAVNGVINIITKDPKEQLGLTVTGGGGSRGTTKEYAGYGFQTDKLRLRASSEYERSDGYLDGNKRSRASAPEYGAIRGSVHAIYEAGPKDTLTLSGGSEVLDDNWTSPRPKGQPDLDPRGQAEFMLARWEHRVQPGESINLTGYVNDFYELASAPWSDYRYQQFALQLNHTLKPVEDHTLTWGIDTRFDLYSSTGADPYITTQDVIRTGDVGIYAQDEWQLAPKWTLTLGGRVDYDAYGGFQPSARASLAYALSDNSQIYGAVSRAFHMPPGPRRFWDLPTSAFIHVTTVRSLDPETLVAYELGYRGRHFDRLDVNTNVFWHSYNDLIGFQLKPGPPGLFQTSSDNGPSLSLYGLETDMKYALTKSWRLLGNYTFEMLDSTVGPGNPNPMTPPKHKFMVGTQYDVTKDFLLTGNLYYVDTVFAQVAGKYGGWQQIPPYLRLDLRAEYRFWKDKASVAVGVRNLIDDRHPEGSDTSLALQEVPRMVYAEMRLTLK
jgi:iron complex outermembrane recepter protein